MKGIWVVLVAVSVLLLIDSAVSAEVVNTYAGPITVTPGTICYGEVGTLLNPGDIGQAGLADQWPNFDKSFQEAGSTLDHYWVQSATNEIIWGLINPVNAIYAVPGTDHGPLPMENMEFKMFGSNDGTGWTEGLLTAIFKDGWDGGTGLIAESDDYTTRWDFSQNFKFFKSVGMPGVVDGWTDYDPEIDGIAAVCKPVPEPSSLLVLGSGMTGAFGYLLRRRRIR